MDGYDAAFAHAAPAASAGGAAAAKPPKDYTVTHEMKKLPAVMTRRGVIDADVDKRFTLHAHHDIPCAAMKTALRAGFTRNAYTANAKIQPFVDVCTGTLKARSSVVIVYTAATKTTRVWLKADTGAPGARATTQVTTGADFMKAVWSVWLGNVERPEFGDALVERL